MIIFLCGSNECMQRIHECMLLLSEVREKKRRDQTEKKKKLDMEPDRVTWSQGGWVADYEFQCVGNNRGTSAVLAELQITPA